MDAALVAALLWIAPSFGLHIAVHEGSHALAAIAVGAQVTDFKPYPHMSEYHGKMVWGSMSFKGNLNPGQLALIAIAPFVVEAAWSLIAAHLSSTLPKDHWLRGILLVESAAALIDMTNWSLDPWKRNNQSSDAMEFGYNTGIEPKGFIMFPPVIGIFAYSIAFQ